MSIDLSEFHDVFFEECFEGLGVMESGLLTLDKGTDVEQINAIIRGAHSIKGGSASFGFMDISSFTHVMETLLDEMHDGRREVSQPVVDLLLESVYVQHGMVIATQQGEDNDADRSALVQQKLEATLQKADINSDAVSTSDDTTEAGSEPSPACAVGASSGWHIRFQPDAGMMKNGNQPARIFRELHKLAEMRVTVDTSALPTLAELEPESSYLSWTLELLGHIDEAQIRALFSWVEDDCELIFSPLLADAPVAAADPDTLREAEPDPDGASNAATAATEAQPADERQPPATSTPAVAVPAAENRKAAASKESGSIRVGIDKVDSLINMVGELVITQSMLSQISNDLAMGDAPMLEKLLDGQITGT